MRNNLPNILTVSRIMAIPVIIAVLLVVDPPVGNWLALAIYTYACITDFLDGYLARVWRIQSSLGRFLDPIADKLLVASVLLMLVGVDRFGGLHILPAAVILCREIVVSGLREFLAGLKVGVPVSRLAKWKTTTQMLALGFLIVGPAGPAFGPLSTLQVGLIGLWGAALVTLITGADYLYVGLKHITSSVEPADDNAAPASSPRTPREAGK